MRTQRRSRFLVSILAPTTPNKLHLLGTPITRARITLLRNDAAWFGLAIPVVESGFFQFIILKQVFQ
jgi:hypothetical protein